MGAELWYHLAPWHADADEALRALQARFFGETYDLQTLLPQKLQNARDAVAAAKADGDPYRLADFYADQVNFLEAIISKPIPADRHAQIALLRQVCAHGGDPIGNVLDVKGVSMRRDQFVAEQLTESQIARFAGTPRPMMAQVGDASDKINAELGRGECVCFPVYDDLGMEPIGWHFVGNTVD